MAPTALSQGTRMPEALFRPFWLTDATGDTAAMTDADERKDESDETV